MGEAFSRYCDCIRRNMDAYGLSYFSVKKIHEDMDVWWEQMNEDERQQARELSAQLEREQPSLIKRGYILRPAYLHSKLDFIEEDE